MKQYYILFVSLFASLISTAQNLEIADPVLKNILVNTNCSDSDNNGTPDSDIDTNNDLEISYEEAGAVSRLYIDGPVTSMAGVDSYVFQMLTLLSIRHTVLTSLTIEGYSIMQQYQITDNLQLTSLLFKNTDSQILNCSNNNLSSLQFSNANSFYNIDCSNNNLTAVNLHEFVPLNTLNCSNNDLTELNLHGLSQLVNLNCSNNELINLVTYKIFANPFQTLDFSGNTEIENICCNVEDQQVVQEKATLYGLSGVNIVTECNYVPPTCPPGTICFDDANLKFMLLSTTTTDTNADGEIQFSEALAITDLTIGGSIHSLYGLNFFTNLTTLTITSTQVAGVYDLTALVNLENLTVQYNHMVDEVKINGLSNLSSLTIYDNHELAVIAASGLTGLTTANINKHFNMHSLSFPGASSLSTLDCSENALSVLNLADAVNLTSLTASSNLLHTITIGASATLTDLMFQQNKMTSLNFSTFSGLQHLNLSKNLFTAVNFTGLNSVQSIDCSENNLAALDASNLPMLTELLCGGNDIMSDLFLMNNNAAADLLSLSLTGNYSLEHICADPVDYAVVENSINAVPLNGITLDSTCVCSGPCADSIVFIPDANFKAKLIGSTPTNFRTRNLAGQYFAADANSDGEIQRSEAANVFSINVNQSVISSLEGIGSFVNLGVLDCVGNTITSLDLSNNSQLVVLDCNINGMISLDLSGLTKLQNLDCGVNQLTSLDLGNMVNLNRLQLNGNPQLNTLFIKNGKDEAQLFISGTPNLQYICADESQVDQIAAILLADGNTTCAVNSYCSFTPGGVYYTVKGHSRYDLDGNGCSDSDFVFHNMKINVSNGEITNVLIGDSSAAYNYYAEAGLNTITPVLEHPEYFNISPASFPADFPEMESPLIQNFCITANGVHPDLEIAVIPVGAAVPGFNAEYKIVYRNKGTHTQSGSVNFNYDLLYSDFTSAVPAPLVNFDGHVSWNFADLLPYEIRTMYVTLEINQPMGEYPVDAGDVLYFTSEIISAATDDMPADNIFSLNQTVLNSLDPNDKTCLQGTIVGPESVGNFVHYLIRFENLGTFSAQNVVVKDIIDIAKYDMSSLLPVDGSHAFTTRITEGNKVEFIFEGINLPFDNDNNDGYVAFKIKTLPSLEVGDTFSNTASIYFDYNYPIVTNTATTTIAELGTSDFEFADHFTLYPNPVADDLHLKIKSDLDVSSIAVYNALGQLVLAIPNASGVEAIDTSNLQSGNYYIKIHTDYGSSTAKFLKK